MKLELTAYLSGLLAARDSTALHHLRVALVEAEGAVVTLRRADALNALGYEATRREFQRLADIHRTEMRRNLSSDAVGPPGAPRSLRPGLAPPGAAAVAHVQKTTGAWR